MKEEFYYIKNIEVENIKCFSNKISVNFFSRGNFQKIEQLEPHTGGQWKW